MSSMATTIKAATHTVTPSPAGFDVISGTSGRRYLVKPLSMGGAACNCAFGRHSVSIASRCSHVKAVEAFAAVVLAPKPEPKAAGGRTYKMTLTGKRGAALESFWAGRTTAREALASMRHNIPSETVLPPAASSVVKLCPHCSDDRPGFMLVYVCAHDWKRGPRNNCGPATCARWEVCAGCYGTGMEKD